MWTRRCTAAAALAIPSFAACSAEDDLQGSSSQLYCAAMCKKAARCDELVSRGLCERDCGESLPRFNEIDPGAARAAGDCIQELACSDFFEEDAFVPCWEEVQATYPPSQTTRDFCEPYAERLFECASFYGVAECEQDWAIYTNAGFAEVESCMALDDCAAFLDCLAARSSEDS